jgi:hypothetical protein
MLKFLKYFLKFFRSVDIFYSKDKIKYKLPKYFKFYFFKSFSNIKSKTIKEYFHEFKEKKERFKKGQYFLVLCYKNKLVSSGWINAGKSWLIAEIDRKIKLLNQIVIFDFITSADERRRGHYTKLLKIIRNKFGNKYILIYALSSNKSSQKAIIKSGFKYGRRLYKISFERK